MLFCINVIGEQYFFLLLFIYIFFFVFFFVVIDAFELQIKT